MGAGITETDGFFAVREPAWWDLKGAHVLADYPTREEAKALAHPWEPTTEPLYRKVPTIVTDPDGAVDVKDEYERLEEFDLVTRDDTGAPLGVKPETRSLVTNAEMYDVAEAIMGEGGREVRYETGGSLFGGRKVWLLMRFDAPMILRGDPKTATIAYFALQNANDGSGSFRGQGLNTRIVCANTSLAADLEATSRGTEFVFRHTAKVADRIEEAKIALSGWRESVKAYAVLSEHLAEVKITAEQKREFIHAFVPLPQESLISDRVRANVYEGRQKMFDILAGETCANINESAYGLVQASVEYSQWYRKSHSKESLFKRSFLDRSRLTSHALSLALEIAKA